MRSLITSLNITLDGFTDHDLVVADDDHHAYCEKLCAEASTRLLGRPTHELFESFWPEVAATESQSPAINAFAKQLEALEKVVVSRRGDVSAARRVLASMDDAAKLKAGSGGPIVVFGSPGLTEALLDAGLVDECHFCVQQILAGRGRAFAKSHARIDLEPLARDLLRSGTTILRFRPKRRAG